MNPAHLTGILPEITIGATAVVVFLLAAFPQAKRGWLIPAVTALGLGAALILLVATGLAPAKLLFGGLIAHDPMSTFFRGLAWAATLVGVILAVGSPSILAERRGEYHGLLLVLAMAMGLLASSSNLLMIYVSMEAVSLCSYLLTGWDARKGRSGEAGLKYVLYGGVASGIMLFGISLLYGLTGDLSLQVLATVKGAGAGYWGQMMAILFVMVGLGYKVALVPFHMWCPDVYEGAPTPFTALLSVGPKAAGFAVLLRFFSGLVPGSELPWEIILAVLAAITMTLGNLSAIMQNNLKRLLAYSSIAHAGYLMMGVVAGGVLGSQAVILYMAVYLIMNMGAFAVVSAVDRSVGSEDISAYRGLGRRAPVLGIVMAVFLFSLTGLPPTVGFVGKLYLFVALLERGGFWLITLAIVGALNSVVSLYYYARVVKAMFLEPSEEGAAVPTFNMATAVAGVMAVPTLVLGVFWHPLAELASWAGGWLG